MGTTHQHTYQHTHQHTYQHTYQNNEFQLNGKSYYNSNVFVQPTTYVVRDPRYGTREVYFEYVYKPVFDFGGNW